MGQTMAPRDYRFRTLNYQLPHRTKCIWLAQLHDYGAGAELVTSVPRVPVIVARIAIQQGVARPADALDDARRNRDCRNIGLGNDDAVGIELEGFLGVGGLEGDDMKHLVHGVVSSHDPYKLDNARAKVQLLPRPAVILGVVADPYPVLLIHRHINVVGVSSLVTVP